MNFGKDDVVDLGMQKLPGNIKENIVLDINSIPDNI
jgi:hypothetical protein